MTHVLRGLVLLGLWVAIDPNEGSAQASPSTPRFFVQTADKAASLVEVDPSTLPSLRRRLSIHVARAPRREVLQHLGRIAGLEFVYANDLIPVEDSVAVDLDGASVAAALVDIVRGADIDLVAGSSGTVVLVRRQRISSPGLRADTLRGRVRTDSGRVLAGAQVIITRGPDRAVFRTTTDQGGRFEVVVDSGTGDYLVYVAAPPAVHVETFRKRVTRAGAHEHLFVIEALLKSQATAPQLETVTVRETNPKPRREDDRVAERSGMEVSEASVAAALLPDQRGDLNAVGGTVPGVTPMSGGFSVLGLPSSQNTVTLNGLAFPGTSMPREAMTMRRLVTSTYDPSRGWFSGADTRVTLSHDFLFAGAYATTTVDDPSMQGGDASGLQAGQRYRNLVQSAGAIGFIGDQRLSYNISGQVARRSASISTLENLNAGALNRAGVDPSIVRLVLRKADSLRIPISAAEASQEMTATSASFLAGVSSLARDLMTFQPRKSVGAVTLFAANDDAVRGGGSTISSSSTGSRAGRTSAALQASLSTFVTPQVLHDLRSSISVADQRTNARAMVPGANVLVGSAIATASSIPVVLRLGGSSDGETTSHHVTWETQIDTRFYAWGRANHRARISIDARLDALRTKDGANAVGRYSYQSVADFAANRPSSFTRTLSTAPMRSSVWNAYLALGDYWKVSRAFELLYGLRVDASRFASRQPEDQALRTAFAVDPTFTPRLLHVSPRLGFTWGTDHSGMGGGTFRSRHGVFVAPMIGMLRGGIGEFRSIVPPSLVVVAPSYALARQVSCIGTAVPTPDWGAYLQSTLSVPSDCADGSAITSGRAAGVPASVVSPAYAPPRSWRANLAWSAQHESLVWMVEGVYAINLDQPSLRNLNFTNVPRFVLPTEGDRPVFAPVSAIVPASGLVSEAGARRISEFGSVWEVGSQSRSTVRQLTVTVAPSIERIGSAQWFGSLAYTVAASRALGAGFDGSTFGSPVDRAWSRGSLTPRHSFILQASAKTANWTVSLFGRVASGLPYSPMIASDVNGDGLANDRAFVFDPASIGDTEFASGLRSLLANAPAGARRCLTRQLGRAAVKNGCEGPWMASSNIVVQPRPGTFGTWSKRIEASLYVANPLAAVDQAIHGSQLRGWGDPSLPDPMLYRVTGFDEAAKRYRYMVNPMFGRTSGIDPITRTPWRITLDLRLSLGPSADKQVLERSLSQGRNGRPGRKRTAVETQRFYSRVLPDPFAGVLELTDSLMLSTDQVRAIVEGQSEFNVRKDSAIKTFSQWLASLPDQYDTGEALRRQTEMYTEVLNIGRDEIQHTMQPVLNRIQIKLLPWPADVMFRATESLTMDGIRRR